MNIDNTVVQTLIVLFPGVLASFAYSRLKASKHTQLWTAFVEFVVFAFLSYAIARPLASALGVTTDPSGGGVDVTLTQTAIVTDWVDFYIACVVGLILSVIAAVFHNHKIINRLARRFRITSSFGDEDVWQYIHNSPNVEWVFVRDAKQNVVYFGKISQYSDPYKARELLLTDVEVYPNAQSDGTDETEAIQTLDAVYLSRPQDDWTIEIPALSNALPATVSQSIAARALRSAGPGNARLFQRYYSQAGDGGTWELSGTPSDRHRRRLSQVLTSLLLTNDTSAEEERDD